MLDFKICEKTSKKNPSVCLSVCLFVCLSSICPSVCLSLRCPAFLLSRPISLSSFFSVSLSVCCMSLPFRFLIEKSRVPTATKLLNVNINISLQVLLGDSPLNHRRCFQTAMHTPTAIFLSFAGGVSRENHPLVDSLLCDVIESGPMGLGTNGTKLDLFHKLEVVFLRWNCTKVELFHKLEVVFLRWN